MERVDVEFLILRARGLALFRGVLDSAVARDFLGVLGLLGTERPDPGSVADAFGRLWEGLALDSGALLPDAWQSYLVERILDDENPFSLGAERGELKPVLLEQARRDLGTLRALFELDARTVLGMVEDAVPGLGSGFPGLRLRAIVRTPIGTPWPASSRRAKIGRLARSF